MVECGGLENRCRRKVTGGSNPPLSAIASNSHHWFVRGPQVTDATGSVRIFRQGKYSNGTKASVKRPDKGRSERGASTQQLYCNSLENYPEIGCTVG